MKEMTIDFDDDRKLSIEKNNNSVIISLSKEMIPHVKFVFEDSGIPGVVGPHLYMNADDIVTKYLEGITNKNNKTDFQKKKNDKRNFERQNFERQYQFAQKVSSLINEIYFEKNIEKKKKLVKDSLLICQKSRHNIRNHEEMYEFLYNIKNTLEGYKGGFINPDAEYYYMTKIYPIFRENGDEAFVYFLDQIK